MWFYLLISSFYYWLWPYIASWLWACLLTIYKFSFEELIWKVFFFLKKKKSPVEIFSLVFCEFCQINSFLEDLHTSNFGISIQRKSNDVKNIANLNWTINRFSVITCVFILIKIKNTSSSSRPEVFCKNRCPQNFQKIPSKTPVPESVF